LRFRGIKKSSSEEQFLGGRSFIDDTTSNDAAVSSAYRLIAGTAWLFARPELNQTLDYLFVDDAGKVSLANIVTMGHSAGHSDSICRGKSSPDDVDMEIKTFAASCPWSSSTVPTRPPGGSVDCNKLTCIL
jgi:hypothetical protein